MTLNKDSSSDPSLRSAIALRGDFRKKPVVVHAVKWTGDNLREIIEFTGRHPSADDWTWEHFEEVVRTKGLKIFTLEGHHMASIGDWIVKGVKGEFYPCKPDIFAATYEPALANPPSVEERMIPHRVAPVCDEHDDKGGARAVCPYCVMQRLYAALSEIDYLCGEPNEMRVSAFDVYYEESAVVENVKRALAPRPTTAPSTKAAHIANRYIGKRPLNVLPKNGGKPENLYFNEAIILAEEVLRLTSVRSTETARTLTRREKKHIERLEGRCSILRARIKSGSQIHIDAEQAELAALEWALSSATALREEKP